MPINEIRQRARRTAAERIVLLRQQRVARTSRPRVMSFVVEATGEGFDGMTPDLSTPRK